MPSQAKLYAVLALLALVVVFAFQNYAVVEIKFLFWSFKTSRAILILALLLIGAVVGWLAAQRVRLRK